MVRSNHNLSRGLLVLGLLLVPLYVLPAPVEAQAPEPYIDVLRSFSTADLGVSAVAGLAFSPTANAFLLLEGQSAGQPADRTRVVMATPYQDPAGSVELAAAAAEIQNAAFDESRNRLVMFDQAANELIAVAADANGVPSPDAAAVSRFDGRQLGMQRAQGMAFNPRSGRVFLLDATRRRVVHVTPDGVGRLDGAGARVGQFNLSSAINGQLRGIAFNPANGNIFVLSPSGRRLHELTETGQRISTRNLAQLGLRDPQAIMIAPSSDGTDDPATMNLFVTDGGQQAPGGQSQPSSQIVELSLVEPNFSALENVSTLAPSLVRTFATSRGVWNPSSPDPSGIAYQPSTGRLLISDGEVEENHPDFQGVNVFIATLGGGLVGTCNTLAFSNEPTGMGVNPLNGRIYISDDNQDRIYEINLGADGQYCTADDSRTFVNLNIYGTIDAESVAVGQGTMFVADGVGAETWIISLGPNGVLGGDDSLVGRFDTFAMGIRDPEGIEYNPDTGTLYLVSTNTSDRRIVETTTGGVVLQNYDLTFLGSVPRSGLAYAPGSLNPAVSHVYIANRGVDNGADPNENDGLVYEVDLDLAGPAPTLTSTATNTPAPPTSTFTPAPPTNTPTNTPTGTPTNTFTPVPPTNTFTPAPPTNTPTNTFTPAPPTSTFTPVPPTSTFTPAPPTNTSTNTPTGTPTSTPGSSFTLSFGPTDDAHVVATAATSNFGASTTLNVDNSPTAHTLLRFVVTGVNGQPVTSARLRLHVVGASNRGGDFRRVADNSWSEATVTWNNAPAADTAILASLGAVAVNTWYEVDLGALITGDGTYSLRITSPSSDGADFVSSEGSAALRPQLNLTVGGTPPTATSTPTSTPVPPTSTPTSTPIGAPTSTPTSTAGAGAVLTFGSNADSYILATSPDTNFGAATTVNVDNSPTANALFRFVVTGVGGRPVTGARLRLFTVGGSVQGGSFRRVADNGWGESTVTWNNAPPADATVLASLGAVAANTFYEVDLSALITGDGTYSLRITSPSSDGADYATKERSNAAQRPQLIVTLGAP